MSFSEKTHPMPAESSIYPLKKPPDPSDLELEIFYSTKQIYDTNVDSIACPCLVLGHRCSRRFCNFSHDVIVANNTRMDLVNLHYCKLVAVDDKDIQSECDRLEHICNQFLVFDVHYNSFPLSYSVCDSYEKNDVYVDTPTNVINKNDINIVLAANDSINKTDVRLMKNEKPGFSVVKNGDGFSMSMYDLSMCCLYDCRPYHNRYCSFTMLVACISPYQIWYYVDIMANLVKCYWSFYSKIKIDISVYHTCNSLIDYYISIMCMCLYKYCSLYNFINVYLVDTISKFITY